MKKYLSFLPFAALLSGCGSMPTGTVGYYLPQGDFDVVVTQTAACASQTPILKTNVSFVPQYSRDTGALYLVDLGNFDSGKSNLTFSFYDDGRLKGINSSQTGQGGDVLTAVSKALPVISAFAGLETFGLSEQSLIQGYSVLGGDALTRSEIENLLSTQAPQANCTALQAISSDPVTVVREARAVLQSTGRPSGSETMPFAIPQVTLPTAAFQSVNSIFGRTSATFTVLPVTECGTTSATRQQHCVTSSSRSGSALSLRQPARVRVAVTILGAAAGNQVFESEVLIPQYGPSYSLPIEKSGMFGESTFELTLSEAGAVQSLGYSKGSGTAAAVGAISELANQFAEDSAAEQAAAIKAEADVIAQQQRLIRCQLDPANCT